MQDVELRMEMTGCDPVAIRMSELWPLLRHPMMLLLVCVLTLPAAAAALLPLSGGPAFTGLAGALRHMLAPVTGVLVLGGLIRVIAGLHRGSDPLPLRVEPLALAALVVADCLSFGLSALAEGLPDRILPWRLLLLLVWHAGLSAAAIIFANRFLIPPILREMRATAPAPDPAPDLAPPPPSTVHALPGIFAWQEVVVPMDDLRSVRADGNCVTIATAAQSHVTKGPFGEATAALDPRAGLLVSRSLWLALREITGAYRDRGELFLTLRGGTTVKVARPRQAEVTRMLAGQVPSAPG